MDPVLPLVLRGPAIIGIGGKYIYTKGDIKRKFVRKTFDVVTDMYGKIDTRMESAMWELDFEPAGELRDLAAYYPHGPSNLVATNPVGDSIMTDTPVVWTKDGKKITWQRGGVSKMPTLYLSARKQAFGSMGISVIGKAAVLPNTTEYYRKLEEAAFTNVDFDGANVITDNYIAALGSRATPFDGMGARTGFELEPTLELDDVPDDGIGIADRRVVSVGWKCRFAPNNLTEAQIDELAQTDDTDAILPGQSVARGNDGADPTASEDLVISGDALVATLHRAGVVSVEGGYGVKVDRNGMVEWANKHAWAVGVVQPLITLALTA